MIALIILAALIIIIALLLFIRAELHIIYKNELSIFVRVLFIKYNLFPETSKKFSTKKFKKQQIKKRKAAVPNLRSSDEIKDKSSFVEKLNIIKEILGVVFKMFHKHLRVRINKLHISVATSDAAQTAILYGTIAGSISALVELIDSYTNLSKLRKCSVVVEPDFLSDKIRADINISLSISVFGALMMLLKAFWKYTVLKNDKVK